MKLEKGSRIAIVAASGGGKTTASQAILVRMNETWPEDPMYVIDNKPSRSFDKWWRLKGITRWNKDAAPNPISKGILIWRPKDPDIKKEYNTFMKRLFVRGRPFVLYIDELELLSGESEQGSYPAYLRKLLKDGREKKYTIIVGSQEASYIPRQILGQSNYIIAGHLNQLGDKEKMARILGLGKSADDWRVRHEHGLWVLDQTRPIDVAPAQYYENIQELLG